MRGPATRTERARPTTSSRWCTYYSESAVEREALPRSFQGYAIYLGCGWHLPEVSVQRLCSESPALRASGRPLPHQHRIILATFVLSIFFCPGAPLARVRRQRSPGHAYHRPRFFRRGRWSQALCGPLGRHRLLVLSHVHKTCTGKHTALRLSPRESTRLEIKLARTEQSLRKLWKPHTKGKVPLSSATGD